MAYVIAEPFFLSRYINPRIFHRLESHAEFAQFVFENADQFEGLSGSAGSPAACYERRERIVFSYKYCIEYYLPLIVPGEFSIPIRLVYPRSIVSRIFVSDYGWSLYYGDHVAHVTEEGTDVIGIGRRVQQD